ncbi:MAG: sulfotransferase [Bacteroidales bacterium]|nr:sulfotransferase [Bacteroidales bacterium]
MKSKYLIKIKDIFNFYLFLIRKKRKKRVKIISVFSSPRGGSTWLTDILNKENKAIIVWEPLFKYKQRDFSFINPFAYPELENVGFDWNQYIPENAKWKDAQLFFNKLFSQKIINIKLFRFNNFKAIKNYDLYIYKFCFGNLMLPWLVNNFEINSILLVRHPCAVVASQLKRGFSFKKEFIPRLFEGKHKEIYIKYREQFEKITTKEEYLSAIWAITNLYPIKHKYNNKKWLTISYESLLLYPQKELTRLSEWIGTDIIKNYSYIFKPSFTTDEKSNFSKEKQISKWKDYLSQEQVYLILRTIENFNVDFYTEDTEPNYNILYNK